MYVWNDFYLNGMLESLNVLDNFSFGGRKEWLGKSVKLE